MRTFLNVCSAWAQNGPHCRIASAAAAAATALAVDDDFGAARDAARRAFYRRLALLAHTSPPLAPPARAGRLGERGHGRAAHLARAEQPVRAGRRDWAGARARIAQRSHLPASPSRARSRASPRSHPRCSRRAAGARRAATTGDARAARGVRRTVRANGAGRVRVHRSRRRGPAHSVGALRRRARRPGVVGAHGGLAHRRDQGVRARAHPGYCGARGLLLWAQHDRGLATLAREARPNVPRWPHHLPPRSAAASRARQGVRRARGAGRRRERR